MAGNGAICRTTRGWENRSGDWEFFLPSRATLVLSDEQLLRDALRACANAGGVCAKLCGQMQAFCVGVDIDKFGCSSERGAFRIRGILKQDSSSGAEVEKPSVSSLMLG